MLSFLIWDKPWVMLFYGSLYSLHTWPGVAPLTPGMIKLRELKVSLNSCHFQLFIQKITWIILWHCICGVPGIPEAVKGGNSLQHFFSFLLQKHALNSLSNNGTDVRMRSALPTKRPCFAHAIHKLFYYWKAPMSTWMERFFENVRMVYHSHSRKIGTLHTCYNNLCRLSIAAKLTAVSTGVFPW